MPLNKHGIVYGSHFNHPISVNGNIRSEITNLSTNNENQLNLSNSQTAFGELSVEQLNPTIQYDFNYGILETDLETFINQTGSVSQDQSMAILQTGTNTQGYAVCRSKRLSKYRCGQGNLSRFTALFNSPVINSLQIAGLFSSNNGLFFGYNGTQFGICKRSGGLFEVYKLTITTGASSNSNITLTLNDTANIIAVTSGTTQHNAYEISNEINDNINGYEAEQINNEVIIYSIVVGNQTGVFSFNAGSTGMIATLSNVKQGNTNEEIWTYQSNWNKDVMDGSSNLNNPSGVLLDQTKLNVYQISYQYLGAGAIDFFIEDQTSGVLINVHQIKYTNQNIKPSLSNPNMPLGFSVANLGNTSNITMKSASMASFNHGIITRFRNPWSYSNNVTSLGTTNTNVITIRNCALFHGFINQRELLPVKINIANDSAKNAIIEVSLNPIISGEKNFNYIDENNSSSVYDISGTTISNGNILLSLAIGKTESLSLDIQFLNLKIERKEELSISARLVSGSNGEITASITWFED